MLRLDLRNIPLWFVHCDNRVSSKVRRAVVNPVDHLEDRLRERERSEREAREWVEVGERGSLQCGSERERGSAGMKEMWGSDQERESESLSAIFHLLVMERNLFASIF